MSNKNKNINSYIIVTLYLLTSICYFVEGKSVTSIVFLVCAVAEVIVTIIFNRIEKKKNKKK